MADVTNENQEKRRPKGRKRSSSSEEAPDENSEGGVPLKKGPWTAADDEILKEYVRRYGEGNWNAVRKHTGLMRCGKSCRLRWANHLRPDLKKGTITPEEERLIIELHAKYGNKWARMAAELPGRTDNEIKNFWNTRAKRHRRSGKPIYPPDVSLQVLDESQDSQNRSTLQIGEVQHPDFFQADALPIPEADLTDYEAWQQELLHHFSLSKMKKSTMVSSDTYRCDFPPLPRKEQVQHLETPIPGLDGSTTNRLPLTIREQHGVSRTLLPGLDGSIASPLPSLSEKICEPSGISGPVDMNLETSCELPTVGNLILCDRISSSSEPVDGMMKLELPSLQCLEAQDPLITHASLLPSLGSSCISSQSNCLLEAVLYQSCALSSSQSQMPGDAVESLSSNPNETEEEVPNNPNFLIGCGFTSVSTRRNPIQRISSDGKQAIENIKGFDASPKAGDLASETSFLLDWMVDSEIQINDELPLFEAMKEILGEDFFSVNEGTSPEANQPKDSQMPRDWLPGSGIIS